MSQGSQYYAEKLSAERLRKCYDLAPPRVRQYLEAEIRHVLSRIHPSDVVLELGCGSGRVLQELAPKASTTIGVDNSLSNLRLARATGKTARSHQLLLMDAGTLSFRPDVFDVVLGIQNGISAFKVEPQRLLRACIRVTRPGGLILLSSYAEAFWDARLEWFELQAKHGLVGEIDTERTGNGVIACRDGFRATTFTPSDFRTLCTLVGVDCRLAVVDQSSVFCEIRVD